MVEISENIYNIRKHIEDACANINRRSEDIKLIAVTKTISEDNINTAIQCGIDCIGENKVQEIRSKYDKIKSDVEVHMIGHLQTNKVKYIIDKVSLIHSLDSIRLAKEINKRAKKSNKVMNVLVQVNVAEDDNKFGIHVKDLHNFLINLSELENIKVKGLMTIVPHVNNTEEVRPYFREMKNIFDDIADKKIYNIDMKYLSMGMTNDYLVAIEEGANMVRIGTGIFGKRNYNI